MDPESEKLDDLSERIRKAKAEADPASKAAPSSGGGNVGFEFVGSVVGAGVLGALLDHAFGTSPWCLLGMVIVGFAAGIMSAWRSMQKPGKSE